MKVKYSSLQVWSKGSQILETMESKEFEWYLAGLIDSIGIIKVPLSKKIHPLHTPKIIIRLKKTEMQLLESIKKVLDTRCQNILIPSTITKKEKNYIDLEITDLNLLILIINMVKNKLMTIQIGEMNNLINYINIITPIFVKNNKRERYLSKLIYSKGYNKSNIIDINDIQNIEYPFSNKEGLEKQKQIITSSWLRALIDTKGNYAYKEYKISLTSNNKKGYNNQFIMGKLSLIFKYYYYKDETKKMYHIHITSLESQEILLQYLDDYPLLTSKYNRLRSN